MDRLFVDYLYIWYYCTVHAVKLYSVAVWACDL